MREHRQGDGRLRALSDYDDLCEHCFGGPEEQTDEETLEACRGVIAAGRAPKDVAHARLLCGLIAGGNGDDQTAIIEFTHAIEAQPAAHLYQTRGQTRSRAGDIDGALWDFAEAARLDEEYSTPHMSAGAIRHNLGQYAEALECYDRALAIDPDNARALFNRCLARANLGEEEKAITDLDRAIEIEPGEEGFRYMRVKIHLRHGRFERAIEDCSQIVALNPDHAGALYMRGISRRRQGDPLGAEADIKRSKDIDPAIAETMIDEGIEP